MKAAASLVVVMAALMSGCGGGADDKNATRVAERFYAAVAAKDGARACAQLEQSAREALEHEEEMPCRKAVLSLKLSGAKADSATVWVTSAQVRLRRGDTVFLDETAAGWRVAAAGCKPQPGEEEPYQCEVEA
jgi:predicted amino acid racemase